MTSVTRLAAWPQTVEEAQGAAPASAAPEPAPEAPAPPSEPAKPKAKTSRKAK